MDAKTHCEDWMTNKILRMPAPPALRLEVISWMRQAARMRLPYQ